MAIDWRVAEAGVGEWQPAHAVVVVEPEDRVEPQEASGVRETRVERPAEPRGQRRLDASREAHVTEPLGQLVVERATAGRSRRKGGRERDAATATTAARAQTTSTAVRVLASPPALSLVSRADRRVPRPGREVDRVASGVQLLEREERGEVGGDPGLEAVRELCGPLPASEKLSTIRPAEYRICRPRVRRR